MPYLVATVDCTHIHHVVHCTKICACHIFLLLLTVPIYTTLSNVQRSAHAISCCYCWLYPSTPRCPLYKDLRMPYLVAIVDCTNQCRVSYRLLQGHANSCRGEIHQPKSGYFGKQKADILANNQLQSPLDLYQLSWSAKSTNQTTEPTVCLSFCLQFSSISLCWILIIKQHVS